MFSAWINALLLDVTALPDYVTMPGPAGPFCVRSARRETQNAMAEVRFEDIQPAPSIASQQPAISAVSFPARRNGEQRARHARTVRTPAFPDQGRGVVEGEKGRGGGRQKEEKETRVGRKGKGRREGGNGLKGGGGRGVRWAEAKKKK